MSVADPWVLVAVALLIILVFGLGLLVPRRPRAVPVSGNTLKLSEISARLASLEEKQNKNDHDVRNIRMAMEALPTKDKVTEVLVKVAGLEGKVDRIDDKLGANGHTLQQIQDFLFKAAVDSIVKGPEHK